MLVVLLAALAVSAPWLAPYDAGFRHPDFLHAPPMPPRVIHDGSLRMPFVYPLTLQDRLKQSYAEDRTRPIALPWFDRHAASPAFLLGADTYGRDLLSLLLYGGRLSIALALVATALALALGALVGAFAAYRGGWLDEIVMRTADFVLILPLIYIVLLLRAVMPLVLPTGTVFVLMTIIFALVGWPFVARGVRGVVAAERQREYVVAAQSLGAGTWQVLSRHLLPACAGVLMVQATLLLPAFILAEATLSYVGLGFPDQVPTWGTMLREAANVTSMTRFPWTLAPALAIFLVVLAANLILSSDKIWANSDVRRARF